MNYSETHLRQSTFIPEEVLEQSVAVIGLGGIGSPTAYMLAKMGIDNMELIDFDKVETHNLSTQMYDSCDVGISKAVALAGKINEELNLVMTAGEYKAEMLPVSDIAIIALDSMDERIKIWKATKEMPQWVIDARMGLEFCRIYAFSPMDTTAVKAYEKSLYTSEEAVQLPCTERAVVYNTFFIASIITSIVKKILMGEDVPFETMADIGKLGIRTFPARH